MGEVNQGDHLYLMAISDHKFRTLRAIRRALVGLRLPASLEDAQAVLDTFNEDGFAYLGQGRDGLRAMERLQEEIADLDCGTALNIDVERWTRAAEARKLQEAGKTPEEVFEIQAPSDPIKAAEAQADLDGADVSPEAWKTAIALLAASEGNPLKACATASTLKRATGAPEVYSGAIRALASTFFWLRQILHDQKIEI